MLSKKRNNRNNLKSRKHKKVSKSRKQNSRSKVLKTRKNILRGGATVEPVTNIPYYTEPHPDRGDRRDPLPPPPANGSPANTPPEIPDRSLKNPMSIVPVMLNTNTRAVRNNPYGNEEL